MADHPNGNYANNGTSLRLKIGLAEMLKGGVIMDVMNVEQAKIAEQAGAVAVMALERVPAMIRAEGGVARMANPKLIKEIIASVSIPVMAKARIGHFAEAQILQHLGVDFIDESEVLTMADETHHIDKHAFKTPFVCGARDLGEALRRIAEGAAMIRTKGEAGTGDVVHAVKHMRQIVQEMKALTVLSEQELYVAAKEHRAPYELVRMVARTGKLPVPNFSAGGIATPADAALMMQLGAESVFVGSGIFMKERATPLDVELNDKGELRNPEERAEAESRAKAIVIATTHYNDPKILSDASEQVIGAMKGLAVATIEESQLLQTRGN
jgi:pyridoxal 5'-phosphate synthase pdxS subunit